MTTILKETFKTLLEELGYEGVQEKENMIAFIAETDYIDYVIVIDELKSNKDILNFAVMLMLNGALVSLDMLASPELSSNLMLQMNSKEKFGSWALDGDIIYWSINVKINNWVIEMDQLKDTLNIIYQEVSLEIKDLLEPHTGDIDDTEPSSEENDIIIDSDNIDEQEEIKPPMQNDAPLPPITESPSQW